MVTVTCGSHTGDHLEQDNCTLPTIVVTAKRKRMTAAEIEAAAWAYSDAAERYAEAQWEARFPTT